MYVGIFDIHLEGWEGREEAGEGFYPSNFPEKFLRKFYWILFSNSVVLLHASILEKSVPNF